MPATPLRSVLRATALSALVVLQAAACVPRVPSGASPASGGRVLRAEEIARGPARTAWELLQGRFPQLRISDGMGGEQAGIGGRGAHAGPPVVVLDGVITFGVDHLRTMPAGEIRSIRVLSGIEASQAYGARGGNGAIVIETHAP